MELVEEPLSVVSLSDTDGTLHSMSQNDREAAVKQVAGDNHMTPDQVEALQIEVQRLRTGIQRLQQKNTTQFPPVPSPSHRRERYRLHDMPVPLRHSRLQINPQ